MTSIDSLDRLPSGKWLRDNPIAAHLGSDEAIEHVLTNRKVGVTLADGTETRIEPGPEHGALAVLTDRRVLFLVGAPADRRGDFVDSVAYESIDAAAAETETLTQRVTVETATSSYSFTARETDAVDAVQSFLETAADVYHRCDGHLTDATDAGDRLEVALASADWDAADDAIDAARSAIAAARDLVAGTPFDPLRDRIASVTADVDERAHRRHVRQAEALADAAERLLDDHQYTESHGNVRVAREHLRTATSLLDDPAAAADGGTEGGVTVDTMATRLDRLASTITARPVTDGEQYFQRARATEDRSERIDALESAFECYRSAATLLGDDDSPFEGDERAAREDAERVIAALVEDHLAAAREAHAAGEWERAADNPESALEALTEAETHGERALELARTYPPGDVAAIESVLDEIGALLDPLRIEVGVSAADE